MITFLASPKAFIGQTGVIQSNAIRSWKLVHPEAEVILYGDSTGTAEACRELGVIHIPEIQCSSSGVPYFNAIVNHARDNGIHDIQVYLNCDILMNKAILSAIRCITFPHYLVIGERLDLSEDTQIDFSDAEWKEELRRLFYEKKVNLHGPTGIDYFIFPRGLWSDLPPLVIGRGGYDGALVAFCLRKQVPVIDATYTIPVVHQFHDYGHVQGAISEVFGGKDANDNKTIHGIKRGTPLISDASWQIRDGYLKANPMRGDFLRQLEIYVRFEKKWEMPALFIRFFWRILNMIHLTQVNTLSLSEVFCAYRIEVDNKIINETVDC